MLPLKAVGHLKTLRSKFDSVDKAEVMRSGLDRIAEKALELGLVATAGKTPEATLYAQVLTEIQRRSRRGDTPRFVKHGKGYIGLSRWMAIGLAFQI